MTSPAIKLARECGIRIHKHSDDECHMISTNLLTRFYTKAQAQALRDAADEVHDDYGCDVDSAATLRRMADELERKA